MGIGLIEFVAVPSGLPESLCIPCGAIAGLERGRSRFGVVTVPLRSANLSDIRFSTPQLAAFGVELGPKDSPMGALDQP